jgi:hypothetical protein
LILARKVFVLTRIGGFLRRLGFPWFLEVEVGDEAARHLKGGVPLRHCRRMSFYARNRREDAGGKLAGPGTSSAGPGEAFAGSGERLAGNFR